MSEHRRLGWDRGMLVWVDILWPPVLGVANIFYYYLFQKDKFPKIL